jgi:hypothetical protein
MSLNFKSCDTRSCKVSFFGSAGGALRIGIEGPPITTNGQEADKMFQREFLQASIKFGRTGHRRRGMAGVTAEVVANQLQDAHSAVAKRRRGLPRGWLFAKRRACINHKGGGLLSGNPNKPGLSKPECPNEPSDSE